LYRKSAVPVAAHYCIEGFHETEVTCSDSRTGCLDGVVIAEVW
jgi:hypothetical protein